MPNQLKNIINEMLIEALKDGQAPLAGHEKKDQVYMSPDPDEMGNMYDDEDAFDKAIAKQERQHLAIYKHAVKMGYKVNNPLDDSSAKTHKHPDITMIHDPYGDPAYAGHIVHHNGKAALDKKFHVKDWHQGHVPDIIDDHTPEQLIKQHGR